MWLIAVKKNKTHWFQWCCPCGNTRQTDHVTNLVLKSPSNCNKPRPLSITDFSISILILVSVISSCTQRVLFTIAISVVEIPPLFFWSVTLSLVQVAGGWVKLSCNSTVLYFSLNNLKSLQMQYIHDNVSECVLWCCHVICTKIPEQIWKTSVLATSLNWLPHNTALTWDFAKVQITKNKGSFYTHSY